ncbi:MAG: type ISP restriction/modification enzyme [Mucilaginibacter sp.]
MNSLGFVTARDIFTIHYSEKDVKKTIEEFLRIDDETARTRFKLGKDVRDWQVSLARKDLLQHYPNKGQIVKVSYRPFDIKYTFYTGKSKGFYCYPRHEIMKHLISGNNIALNVCKIGRSIDSHVYFVSKYLTDKNLASSLDSVNTFPLYLIPEVDNQQNLYKDVQRIPNFDPNIIDHIAQNLNLKFNLDGIQLFNSDKPRIFTPTNLLDYIYAVLYCPRYREEYKEYLKTDFPRIPYPNNNDVFWELVELGSQLRQIHLFESTQLNNTTSSYPVDGDNIVTIINYEAGRVYLNDTQYFDNVPLDAWEFYIGGYQPAQKWLKDRKGRELSFDDILHYQKIIVGLLETDRIMKEIDKIEF